MELKLSKNQVQGFLNNPVWLQMKSDLSEAVSDGLVQLQQVDPKESTEIATIQGGLRRIAEFLRLPENYLEELNEDEELTNMPIDQDFLDGLTDIPKVGEDGVSAPEKEEAKPVESGGGGTNGGPKVEPSKPAEGGEKAVEGEEEADPYKLLDALFEEVKPAAQVKKSEVHEQSKQAEKPPEKKETPADLKFDSSFLPQSDEDFDKILASRANFLEFQNKFLASMHNFYEAKIQGVLTQMPAFQQRAVEEAMQRAAQFVPQQVQEQLTLQKMVDEFYVSNANLVPIRRLVGQVANKVQAAHPDWGYDKIFDETAKQSNKLAQALNLPQIQKANGDTQKKPAFAKVPGGGRKPAVEKTSLQKDIDMLIS